MAIHFLVDIATLLVMMAVDYQTLWSSIKKSVAFAKKPQSKKLRWPREAPIIARTVSIN
jgi:hypothetical protein